MRRSLAFLLLDAILGTAVFLGGCAVQNRFIEETPDELVVNPEPTRKLTISGYKDSAIYLGFRLDFTARNEACRIYVFPTGRLPPVRYLVVDAKEMQAGKFEA